MFAVDLDISEWVKATDELQQKQLPFAVARALTMTAQDAQTEIRRQMGLRFTLRNDWSQRGIVIMPAEKYKTPWTATVMVGDITPYLNLQEDGGIKAPTSAKNLAIPDEIRSNARQILTKSMRPKSLLANKANKAFVVKLPSGGALLVQRTGPKIDKVLYVFEKRAQVKPKLGLKEIAQAVGEVRWKLNMEASLEVALATAR